ncbi:hypothetical protein COU20_01045 [Candidatus Kaiserbacteria bacterium CG10_big_fil_rev_8_21_14_0_10_59_10]|uniref:Uncharacterized protein n=1 Tax=Candidatus Kaiserbacteria bacterium CG10_big_fil_rev_8_21_14_0_10_59_10 TaxID=1974612 RepID=A0A2H0U8H7_9BACT|nr:MAG: hypothetical protein COU20_01045 [Candidatus Kaiserbacteria bacterium CG10_big_fil_rev_8_21_14_0_10_59_10]
MEEVAVSNDDPDYRRTRVQFAQLCARIAPPEEYDERYHQALSEYDEFCEKPLVAAVSIGEENMEFVFGTKTVYLTGHDNVRREIGEFMCAVGCSGYMVENISVAIDGESGYAHPHAFQGGQFCMQRGSNQLRVALHNGRLAEAACLILDALETYGPGTPYCSIDKWPVAKE